MVRLFQRAGAWWERLISTATADPIICCENPSTHQTTIWYMNNNVRVGTADGPTLPSGWNLVAP